MLSWRGSGTKLFKQSGPPDYENGQPNLLWRSLAAQVPLRVLLIVFVLGLCSVVLCCAVLCGAVLFYDAQCRVVVWWCDGSAVWWCVASDVKSGVRME
jgi:hypothetical protein